MTNSHIMGKGRQAGTDRPRNNGVTMIEMLIALLIVAVLVAIATPMVQDVLEKARVARAIGDVRAVQTDLQTYEIDGNGLPGSLSEIGRGDMRDPWGNAYRYLRFPDDGSKPRGARKDRFLVPVNSTFDLYSVGKDGNTNAAMTASSSQDDIVRANDGGFIGLASKF
jgi:general secretion pathway protein G